MKAKRILLTHLTILPIDSEVIQLHHLQKKKSISLIILFHNQL